MEIERNLAKKMPNAIPIYREYLPKINLEIISLPSAAEVRRLYGHIIDKDIPVLVSAINGKADFLVTGDKKDFAKLKAKNNYPFKIVSPSEFIGSIFPEILKKLETKEKFE